MTVQLDRESAVELAICVCCLLLLANGECCAEACHAQKADWGLGLNDHVTLGTLTDACGHDLADEAQAEAHSTVCECFGFRQSTCQLCGDTHHGDRFAATLWRTVALP